MEKHLWLGLKRTYLNGKEIEIIYTFRYFPNRNNKNGEVYYRVTWEDPSASGKRHQDDAFDETDDELDDYIEQEEEKVETIMSLLISRVEGEKRPIYDEFHDALDDVGYYTKIKGIKSNDAQEVERKVALIVATITNIGIVLAIVIPAVLGVKYMIGSAADKAEYKKDMVPYLVGATLLFSICTFVKILQAIGNQINQI